MAQWGCILDRGQPRSSLTGPEHVSILVAVGVLGRGETSMDQPKATDVDKLLAQARRDADVLAVILFGSVACGEQTARSDVD
jgi:hypothetical protein